MQYAINCKKGGFITIRHNDLRDLTVNSLTEVCKDVNIEPELLTVMGEFSSKFTLHIYIKLQIKLCKIKI